MKRLTNIAALSVVVILMVMSALVYLGPKLGYRTDNVISGSMEPTYSINTMVVAHSVDARQLTVGDIITFKPIGTGTLPICHRIVQIVGNNPPSFQTKGDASTQKIDPWTVPAANILGRVDFSFPGIGVFFQFMGTKIGFVLCLILPALVVIWLIFRNLWRDLVKYIRSSAPKAG